MAVVRRIVLVAMMSGARTQRNTALSEKLLARMSKLFPDLQEDSISALILLGNTYSSAGDSNRSSDIRKQIQESRVRPQIGQSWTCIDNQLTVREMFDLKRCRECVVCRVSEPMIGYIPVAKKFTEKAGD